MVEGIQVERAQSSRKCSADDPAGWSERVMPGESSTDPVRMDKLSAETESRKSKTILENTPLLAGQTH